MWELMLQYTEFMYLLLLQCASKKAHTTISQFSWIGHLELRVFQENSTFVSSRSSTERSQILVLEQCFYEEQNQKEYIYFYLQRFHIQLLKGKEEHFLQFLWFWSLFKYELIWISSILKWIYVFQCCSELSIF